MTLEGDGAQRTPRVERWMARWYRVLCDTTEKVNRLYSVPKGGTPLWWREALRVNRVANRALDTYRGSA